MSDTTATVNRADSVDLGGAWGVGFDYFDANSAERKEIMAANATLERDEWETLTDRMVSTYEETLVGIQDLRSAGLTRNVSLATIVDLWQERSAMTDAEVSMDGEAASEEDRSTYETTGVPVPIVHKDFRIPERELRASRKMGNDLRGDDIFAATRSVTEMLEYLLFNGWESSVGTGRGETYQLYGYTNVPTNTDVPGAGDFSTASNIRPTIIDTIDAFDANERTAGNFAFYFSPPQWRELRSAVDPDGDGNMNLRQRLSEEFAQEIGAFRRAPFLDDGEAVAVDLSMDVVELAEAEDVQTIEWQSGSGMTNHFKVMAALAPEIKADPEDNSGVVHITGI